MKKAVGLSMFLAILCAGISPGREWTSSDGRKLEADFISSDDQPVKLKRPSGQVFSLPLDRLSEADRSWVKLQASAPKVDAVVKPIDGPFAKLITGDWELGESGGLSYAFHGTKLMSAEMKYPLVLALHGKSPNTENGKQVGGWMKSFTSPANQSARPCFVLAPMSAQPASGEGMGWSGGEVERVTDLIKAMTKDLPVDPKRIYIVGYSMGGFGTCRIMGSEPRLFAAAIPVAGVSASDVGELLRKPIWMFHAEDDAVVPVAGAREFAEQMKRNKQFKYTESKTGGHGVVGQVFNDPETHEWLFAQSLK